MNLMEDIVEYYNEETENFLRAFESGEKEFAMSFDKNILYIVEVMGEAEDSTQNDRKFDVVVKEVRILGRLFGVVKSGEQVKIEIYNPGYERWVRAYDLKPFER